VYYKLSKMTQLLQKLTLDILAADGIFLQTKQQLMRPYFYSAFFSTCNRIALSLMLTHFVETILCFLLCILTMKS